MTNSAEHIARWKRIWAARLAQLAVDMNVPPPAGVMIDRWRALQEAAKAVVEDIR